MSWETIKVTEKEFNDLYINTNWEPFDIEKDLQIHQKIKLPLQGIELMFG